MVEIEQNMYVRTKQGYICKILKLNEPEWDDGYLDFNDIHSPRIQEKYIVNASHNIIDLIEVGDYVNGRLVTDIHGERIYTFNSYSDDIGNKRGFSYMLSDDIKSIVTKEMYQNVEYRVESN